MSVRKAFRRIRLALRFIAPLTIVLGLLALALVPLVDELMLRWWVNDLDIRSRLVANTMQEQLVGMVRNADDAGIRQLFSRDVQDERLTRRATSPTRRRRTRWISAAAKFEAPDPMPTCFASSRPDRCTSPGSRCPLKEPASGRWCSSTT